MDNKYDRYKSLLREKLDDYRYNHSLNVAECASELALKFGADSEKAYEAGLLHDIMKQASKEEIFAVTEKYGIEMTELELGAKKLWHAMAGAVYIKNELGVDDEDIVNAVRYHTTGRKNMSLLEKIIFTADFISADRTYDGVDRIREKAEIGLTEAMFEGLQFTIIELCEGEKPIHPDTVDAYNDILIGG